MGLILTKEQKRQKKIKYWVNRRNAAEKHRDSLRQIIYQGGFKNNYHTVRGENYLQEQLRIRRLDIAYYTRELQKLGNDVPPPKPEAKPTFEWERNKYRIIRLREEYNRYKPPSEQIQLNHSID